MKPLTRQVPHIEHRNPVQEALSADQAALDLIVSAIPALVWSAGPDGSAEFFSQQYVHYVGLSLDKLRGSGWTVAVHPDDLGALLATWRAIIAAGQAGEAEARLRRYDGEYRRFLCRVNPVRDKSGSIVKWFGINTNIEDCKRAEHAVALEGDFRSIINTIPTAAWTTRPDGYCDFINQVWLDYTGMKAEQAQGWGWAEAIHPDDRKKLVEDWQSCLASGTPVDTEARTRRFDGAYRWFLIRANPLRDESGNIVKWYGANIDVEDRKRGEEALHAREMSWRQIVDNIPGFVGTMGATGEVEFLNRQTLEYFGRTTAELKNWSLIGAVHPDDLPRVIEARKKSIEAGQIYEIEHRCRRADGVYRWFQVRGLPVRDTDNRITAWYLLLTDIDDQKRAEAELRRAYNSFVDAQRLSLTGNFTADIVADEHIWSAELYRIFEFDPVTKITVQMVRDVIHPEDLPGFDAGFARSLGGEDFDQIFRIVTQSGKVKHVHSVGRVIEKIAGRPLFIGAIQDVTEQRRAERALRTSEADLLEAQRLTHTGSWKLDVASGHVIVSPEIFRIFDAKPGEDVSNPEFWFDRIHPEDRPRVREHFERCVAEKLDYEEDYRIVLPDATIRYQHSIGRPILSASGTLVEFLGTAMDVTEQVHARLKLESAFEEIKQLKDQLFEENVALREEIDEAARVNERTRIARELHDTLLQNFHGLMFQFQAVRNLMTRRPDEAMRSLDDAINETKKAIAESRDAIQGLRSEPIAKGNLAELLTSTSRELADSNVNQHPPVFDLIEEGERQTLSSTISTEVWRITLELLRNAYQHADAQRIEAEIRYGDSMFRLRIRDDGKGIEPKVLKEGGRTGHWGLRGIRERVDQIGARLDLWTEPGNGTEVQLLVPAEIAYESPRDGHRAKSVGKVKRRA